LGSPGEGWGTNEALIISILAHRDAAQRRAIRRAYADTYGEELLRSITDEISGDFEVINPPPELLGSVSVRSFVPRSLRSRGAPLALLL
jgi:hypothetical protein